jgi:hypothetical protein
MNSNNELSYSPGADLVRLCVESYHPIDVGNYEGPIHCTAHPHGTPCVTALYRRVPETTVTAEERARSRVVT